MLVPRDPCTVVDSPSPRPRSRGAACGTTGTSHQPGNERQNLSYGCAGRMVTSPLHTYAHSHTQSHTHTPTQQQGDASAECKAPALNPHLRVTPTSDRMASARAGFLTARAHSTAVLPWKETWSSSEGACSSTASRAGASCKLFCGGRGEGGREKEGDAADTGTT